jgi:hypothetical protein
MDKIIILRLESYDKAMTIEQMCSAYINEDEFLEKVKTEEEFLFRVYGWSYYFSSYNEETKEIKLYDPQDNDYIVVKCI